MPRSGQAVEIFEAQCRSEGHSTRLASSAATMSAMMAFTRSLVDGSAQPASLAFECGRCARRHAQNDGHQARNVDQVIPRLRRNRSCGFIDCDARPGGFPPQPPAGAVRPLRSDEDIQSRDRFGYALIKSRTPSRRHDQGAARWASSALTCTPRCQPVRFEGKRCLRVPWPLASRRRALECRANANAVNASCWASWRCSQLSTHQPSHSSPAK